MDNPWAQVNCQRFFIQGPKSTYFEVASAAISNVTTTHIIQQANKELADANIRIQQHEQETIDAINENQEPSPWLRKTGWTRHLQGLDRKQLITTMATPIDTETEGGSQQIQEAFVRIIQKARWVACEEVVGRSALVAVNQKEQGKRASKPFNAIVDRTTITTYNGVWLALIRFWIRIQDWDDEKRPQFRYTEKQRRFFQATQRTAHQLSDIISHGQVSPPIDGGHRDDEGGCDNEGGYIIGMEGSGDESETNGSSVNST